LEPELFWEFLEFWLLELLLLLWLEELLELLLLLWLEELLEFWLELCWKLFWFLEL